MALPPGVPARGAAREEGGDHPGRALRPPLYYFHTKRCLCEKHCRQPKVFWDGVLVLGDFLTILAMKTFWR